MDVAQQLLAGSAAITSDRVSEIEATVKRGPGRPPKSPLSLSGEPKKEKEKEPSFDELARADAIRRATLNAMEKQAAASRPVPSGKPAQNDAAIREKIELLRKITEYQDKFPRVVTDRSIYSVKNDVDTLRAAYISCRNDVSSQAAETQIRQMIYQGPAALEKLNEMFNPFDLDLQGFGAIFADEGNRDLLETEVTEAVIEMRGRFVLPWWLRLTQKVAMVAFRFSEANKMKKAMAAAQSVPVPDEVSRLAEEARRSASQRQRGGASK